MDINALRARLRRAPFDFFSAVSSSTIQDFQDEWHSLCEDVGKACHLLNDEDNSLVDATAALLATSADLLLKTNDETVKWTAAFVDDMEDVFARLSISDVDAVVNPGSLSHPSRSLVGVAPSYIPAAYSWILQNIHNPYPSNEIKKGISRGAGRPIRVITDWFKDVRRHIGWVAMCKKHFQGSRAHAVQAAKHVYLHADSSQLSLSSDILSQFEAIRTRLRNMYPMADDNGDLSDGTDDSFTPSSRSSSSTPSLVFSTDDEDNHSLASFTLDDAPPASLGKRKSLSEENVSRPLKRNRSGYISVTDGLGEDSSNLFNPGVLLDPSPFHIQPIPSLKRRLSDAATEWEDVTAPASLTQCNSPPLRIPKRRLSVSDSQRIPKRPCLPPAVGPRKQAVSTPVPIAHQTTPAADAWFPFELSDTSLSVELFNWDVVVENDAFLYNSLFDGSLDSDGQDPLNVMPLSVYQSSTPLDLSVSSAVDPSVLDISTTFIEPPATHLTTPIYTLSREPITATTTPVFDFDAFFSAVNAESAEPQITQSSPSSSTALSLNDSIELFGGL